MDYDKIAIAAVGFVSGIVICLNDARISNKTEPSLANFVVWSLVGYYLCNTGVKIENK